MECVYCDFAANQSTPEILEPKTAVAAIDWMADLSAREGRQTLNVHLFGGEPLLAEDAVDIVVHRTRLAAAARGMAPVLEVATNGACSESRARFAGAYFSTVSLSMDGPEEYHDAHRRFRNSAGSFAVVERTARLLAEGAAGLNIRVCVSERNVHALGKIAEWMAKEFRPTAVDFEPLRPTRESDRDGLMPPDPHTLASSLLEAYRSASQWGVEVKYSAALREKPRICFCPLANDAVILEADGNLNACYLRKDSWESNGIDLRIGKVTQSGEVRLNPSALNRVRQLAVQPAKCQECFCRFWCAGGCRVTHSKSQSGYDNFCIQTRLITTVYLLEQLKDSEAATSLLANRHAAERLALRTSDRLADWKEA